MPRSRRRTRSARMLVVTISRYTAAQIKRPPRCRCRPDRRVPPGSTAWPRVARSRSRGWPDPVRGHDRAAQEPRRAAPRLRPRLEQSPGYAAAAAGRPHRRTVGGDSRTTLVARRLAGHARHLGYVDAERPPSALWKKRRCWSCRRSTRVSAFRRWKRWRRACRSSHRDGVRCQRSSATPVCSSDATDDVAFAAAIEALLSEPQRRVAQAEAGVLRAREFSWKDSAAQLLAAYRAACDRQRGVKARS